MNRKQLLETLELVRPALADDGLVPVFTNFCFDGGYVHAYKDKIGIIAPCEVQDTFGVHGKTLMDMLRAASASDILLDMDAENVLLKSGRSKMKLPFMPKSEFLFEEPENEQWSVMVSIDEELLIAFQLCLVTSSTDNTMPAFMGVTVRGGKQTHLYSCDGDALSRYRLGIKDTADVQLTIPSEFCEAMLRIADKTGIKHGELYINGEWACAEFGNNFKVYGRIIENNEALDYEAQIKRVIKVDPKWIEIPDEFDGALGRARVVADQEGKPTTLVVEGGKLTINTDTHVGNVKDVLKIDKDQADVKASVSAKAIQRAVGICEEFALFDNCTLYRHGENFMLLMANYEG